MTTIKLYEDNAGAVYLQRENGTTWNLGQVTPDMHGEFADTATAIADGTWEPNEDDGQTPGDAVGLDHIATWTQTDGVRIEGKMGAGGSLYLHGDTSLAR